MNIITSFILPVKDNSGYPLDQEHSDIRKVLSDTFGGWTASQVIGGWVDNGRYYSDQSIRYEVASDNPNKVAEVARYAGEITRQHSIYFTLGNSVAEFIQIDPALWVQPPADAVAHA